MSLFDIYRLFYMYCLLSTQSHIKPADAVRDDIAKLKEDMAKLVQALTPREGNGFQ